MPAVTDPNEILADANVLKMYQSAVVKPDTYDASTRLLNSPYKLLDSADPIVNTKTGLGRKYMECISTAGSIIYFVPGESNYLPGIDYLAKDGVKTALLESETGAIDEAFNKIAETIGSEDGTKYFDFKNRYTEYMKYVNAMLRAESSFMGLGDVLGPDKKTKLSSYNWHGYKFSNFVTDVGSDLKDLFGIEEDQNDTTEVNAASEALFGNWQYVQFYADASVQVDDNFSNMTMESKLKGLIDTGSDLAKEYAFLESGLGGKTEDILGKVANVLDQAMTSTGANGSPMMSRLKGVATQTLKGNSIIFPELWGGFEYNKTTRFTFSLKSPYGDKLSIFLNLFVPMTFLICLAAPRQVRGSANSYGAPFLCKVFSKGWFSHNMSLIDNLSITRGGEGNWTVDGFPTAIDIEVSVKDLYSDFMISKNKGADFLINQSLTDYLSVICGLDITKPQILRQLDTIQMLLKNKIIDIPDIVFGQGLDSIRRITQKIFGNL